MAGTSKHYTAINEGRMLFKTCYFLPRTEATVSREEESCSLSATSHGEANNFATKESLWQPSYVQIP
jgi:hypothetical protein